MEDCSQNSKWKYHVFMSFRGDDTRLAFSDHLYGALVRKSIITFRDDEELDRGEVISEKILDAIEKSLSAIVIISKNYASSTWCLDELLKILESKHLLGQEVFPIFYGVDPSDVRNQRGSFAEAFKKHEENFTENKEKLQKWRDALREVANLSGWDSKDQFETKLIEEVVAQVWKKLELKFPTHNDGLVAIDSRLEDLYSILMLGLEDVRFVGIWGMGGIGKTTLATSLFKKIKGHFDVSCFIANVREASGERNHGLQLLQNKVLSKLDIRGMVIETLSEGKDCLRNLLSNKRVLLVLDDVSSKIHLENLAGSKEWFGKGSRIIVTTRDKHLLISHVVFEMYESKTLNKSESLQLFCENAFKTNKPENDYLKLSQIVIEYAGGLPLALEVLGSFLGGRSLSDWEDTLVKIKHVPHDDILNKLRISYDMLEAEHKTIFLDIACFFKGWYKHKVIQMLESCGLHPTVGINVLIEKSLVTFDGRVIGMHDLLEDMGKTLVSQESPNDPGRRSRLWELEDIDQVLRKNRGTDLVQGIVLKSSPSKPYEAYWDPEAFSKLCNLRILIILCDTRLPLGLKYLPSSLKVLVWWEYPLNALPFDEVQLDELVHLQLINSKVKQLWDGTQYFGKLKVIDLSNSEDLRQTPDISGVPFLEELYLNDCVRLVEVHRSIRHHKKLMILNLMGCINLTIFPSKLEMCSLKTFSLSDCSSVERLPDFGENMTSMSELNLLNCRNLLCLPDSIGNLKALRILNMSGCLEICCLPDNLNQNKALEDLDLSRTVITELYPFLLQLGNLKRLSFRGCYGPPYDYYLSSSLLPFRTCVQFKLPLSISALSSLTVLDLSYCGLTDSSIPPDIGCVPSLERLILSGNNFICLPDCIANLSKLRCLELEDCPQLRSSPVLPPRVRLYKSNDDEVATDLLDPVKLWKLFESSDQELFQSPVERRKPYRTSYYPICKEIPPRFDAKNFFPMDSPYVSKPDSFASVTVGVPDDCHSSGWWGVAVLVAIDAQSQDQKFVDSQMRFYWSFDTLESEEGPILSLASDSTVDNDMYLFAMGVSNDFIYILQDRPSDTNWIKLCSKHQRPVLRENSFVRFEVQVGVGWKIRKGGWLFLGREYSQKVNSGQAVKTPDSEHSADLSKPTVVDQFKGEDVAASDDQNIERSNDNNFLKGKLFRNIRQGFGLSMLALMLGTAVFLMPRQGLRFKQHIATNEDTTKLSKSRQVSHAHKVKPPQVRRINNKSASTRFSLLVYQPPRTLCFSHNHFCSYLTRRGSFCAL